MNFYFNLFKNIYKYLFDYEIECICIDKLVSSKFPSIKNINYNNERTIAEKVNFVINDYLQNLNSSASCKYLVEFSVNNFNLSKKVKNKYINELKLQEKKKEIRPWKTTIPDAFFMYKILNQIKTMFVEYKVHNSFSYNSLMIDFLKFKYYTHAAKISTSFLFILFNKNNLNNPSTPIFKNSFENYYNLGDKSNTKDLEKCNFFYYEKLDKKLNEAFINFEDIIYIDAEMNELLNYPNIFDNIDFSKVKNLENSSLYSTRNLFAKNVLFSKEIVNSFKIIKELYTRELQKNDFFDKLNMDFKEMLSRYKTLKKYIKKDFSDKNFTYKNSYFILSIISVYHDCDLMITGVNEKNKYLKLKKYLKNNFFNEVYYLGPRLLKYLYEFLSLVDDAVVDRNSEMSIIEKHQVFLSKKKVITMSKYIINNIFNRKIELELWDLKNEKICSSLISYISTI